MESQCICAPKGLSAMNSSGWWNEECSSRSWSTDRRLPCKVKVNLWGVALTHIQSSVKNPTTDCGPFIVCVCVCVLGRQEKTLIWWLVDKHGTGQLWRKDACSSAALDWRGVSQLSASESHFNCSIIQPCNSFHVPRCSMCFYARLQLWLSLSPAGSLDTLLLRPHKHTSVPWIFFSFFFLALLLPSSRAPCQKMVFYCVRTRHSSPL